MITDEQARQISIAHWERNANAIHPDDVNLGNDHCGFCKKYVHNDPQCEGCPVSIKTGHRSCFNTPYYRTVVAWRLWSANFKSPRHRRIFRKYARQCVQFLKDLEL